MPYTKEAWSKHPGRNPAHRFEGRERWKVKVPVGIDARGEPILQEITKRGPRNPSRWVPHRGAKERGLR